MNRYLSGSSRFMKVHRDRRALLVLRALRDRARCTLCCCSAEGLRFCGDTSSPTRSEESYERQCGNDRKVCGEARGGSTFSLTRYVRLFTSFRETVERPPARFNGSKLAESELAGHAIPISEYTVEQRRWSATIGPRARRRWEGKKRKKTKARRRRQERRRRRRQRPRTRTTKQAS